MEFPALHAPVELLIAPNVQSLPRFAAIIGSLKRPIARVREGKSLAEVKRTLPQ
jgi:hypothetical protein